MGRHQFAESFARLIHLVALNQTADFDSQPGVLRQGGRRRAAAGRADRSGGCSPTAGVDRLMPGNWHVTTHRITMRSGRLFTNLMYLSVRLTRPKREVR